MNPHLLSEQNNQIIQDNFEGRGNLNHGECVGDENYCNIYSDDFDEDYH